MILKGEGKWCITETWLCDVIGESEVSIPGYRCVRCDRNRHGGGVPLFISDKLEYQVTMCGPNELEFLLVSVHSTNNVNEEVLMDRPPTNSAALDDLHSIFESLDIFLVLYYWEIFVITTIHFSLMHQLNDTGLNHHIPMDCLALMQQTAINCGGWCLIWYYICVVRCSTCRVQFWGPYCFLSISIMLPP